jgi:hypothetical protein
MRPTPFDRGPRALMGGSVTMQLRAVSVSLRRPVLRGALVGRGGCLVASRGIEVKWG